jgi:hypothetical protein
MSEKSVLVKPTRINHPQISLEIAANDLNMILSRHHRFQSWMFDALGNTTPVLPTTALARGVPRLWGGYPEHHQVVVILTD